MYRHKIVKDFIVCLVKREALDDRRTRNHVRVISGSAGGHRPGDEYTFTLYRETQKFEDFFELIGFPLNRRTI